MKVIIEAASRRSTFIASCHAPADGMHVRAEIVEELEKSTFSLSDEWRVLPATPTPEMLTAGECESDSEEATYETVFAAMVAAAPLPPNALANAPASADD